MSFLNFKADDLVYIENMGYGKLVDCGLFESLSLKNVSLSMKKSSIIFDPDMFNAN